MAKKYCFLAPAKINLDLRIGRITDSGLHELDSIMHTISLFDRLYISCQKSDRPAISLKTSDSGLSETEDNLVYKAAKAWLLATKSPISLDFYLEKQIPSAAGLGGGSSDAATTLLALQQLFPNSCLSGDELYEVAFRLGSDVPFFLEKGCARIRGCGNIVEPLSEIPEFKLLLVTPKLEISTRRAYALLDLERGEKAHKISLIAAPWPLAPHLFQTAFRNDFTDVLGKTYGEIACILDILSTTDPLYANLSGSGPTCFAIYEESHDTEAAKKILHSHLAREGIDCKIYTAKLLSRTSFSAFTDDTGYE